MHTCTYCVNCCSKFSTLGQFKAHKCPIDLEESKVNSSFFDHHNNTVTIYDSLWAHFALSLNTLKRQLRVLYGNPESAIRYVHVTQERCDPICGTFSVAFALTKLQGKELEHILCDASRMREHLCQCCVNGALTTFPVKSVTTKSNPYHKK